ncbi:natterin-3-like [Clinocottus analis]|uniref:natterin-3-like n=1 Tax=Clinocottus analis TaxID=304258 RepID=UPI0035BF5C69
MSSANGGENASARDDSPTARRRPREADGKVAPRADGGRGDERREPAEPGPRFDRDAAGLAADDDDGDDVPAGGAGAAPDAAPDAAPAATGSPGSVDRTAPGDARRCAELDPERLEPGALPPGDTFLDRHAYYARGGRAYPKATYTGERLKIEIGRERFRGGFVAHPNAVAAPGAGPRRNLATPTPTPTDGMYVTLDARPWCYVCGRAPQNHSSRCYRRTKELAGELKQYVVSILELAPRDRKPFITSNTTMVTHRLRLSSGMSRQKRQTRASTVFDGSQNLKWVTWSGSLPDGAVSIYNNYADRVDYICKYRCEAGFYNPSQGRDCHYPYGAKEYTASQFEILANKDDFELLEWKDGSHGSIPQHSVKTCSHENVYVGKNKYGLGKVHTKHKAFFLPWKGSEYYYKSYKVLTFGKDVISEDISNIKYNTATTVFKYPPDSMFTTTVINNECSPVVKTPTVSTRSQRESRWDISGSIRIGVSTTFTGGIPLIASGDVEVSSDVTMTFSGGRTTTEESSHSFPLQVTVPPNHYCKVRTVMQKYKADIPFTARLTRRYRNGKTSSTSITGTYHGVDNRDATALVERCRPVTNAEACDLPSL